MATAQSPGWRRQFRKQFRKTKLCGFNAVGRCNNGQNCAFAHSPWELEAAPDLTKTALCLAWQKGQCPRAAADCHFAHGSEELRLTKAFNNAKFSQRTRAAQEDSYDCQGIDLLDFTKLAEDVLSDSTEASIDTCSMSSKSTSAAVQDPVAVSCGLAQQEMSSTSPRNYTDLEDEAVMNWADPQSLPSLHLLPAPPGLGPPVQLLGRPMLPAPPGLGPPMQCPAKPISCHAALNHGVLATHLSTLTPQMMSTLPLASPSAIQHQPMQDPHSYACATLSEPRLLREDSFRPKWLYR
jgi:hypothetical protein